MRQGSLTHQLRICDELIQFVGVDVLAAPKNQSLPRREFVSVGLAAKAFVTFRAIRSLIGIDGAYQGDALTLLRSLYESIGMSIYLLNSDVAIAESYARQSAIDRWEQYELLAKELADSVKDLDPSELSQMRSEYNHAIPRQKGKAVWKRPGARKFAKSVDGFLPAGDRVFSRLYLAVYKLACVQVHPDPCSIPVYEPTHEECSWIVASANMLMFCVLPGVINVLHGGDSSLMKKQRHLRRLWGGKEPLAGGANIEC